MWVSLPNIFLRFVQHTSDYPSLNVTDNQRWVKNGQIFTSAGISAGIDMSLQLVSELVSHELAIKTAKQMDYAWQTAFNL